MNDQAQDRVPYSYDEIFPERFLHAPDLDGRTVTLVITDIWGEYVQNPKQKRKKERGDLCGILAFQGTKREYAMSKQNAWIVKTLWGKDPENIVGKRITLSPVPDSSGFTEHGTRILFVGSPDIDGDRALTLPGGQALTFKKTVPNRQEVVEGTVDPVTGEVADDDIGFDEDAPHAAQEAAGGAPTPDSDSGAAEAVSDEDGQIPGMDADEYAASREEAPTLLHPPKVTATQTATIGRLRKSSGIYEAEYVALLDSYGASAAGELSKENAGYVISALEEREAEK